MRSHWIVLLVLMGCGDKKVDESAAPSPTTEPALAEAAPTATKPVTAHSAGERSVAGFDSIELMGAIDLELTQGPETSVVIDAAPEDLPKVVTKVTTNSLAIYCEDKASRVVHCGKVIAKVQLPVVSGLSLKGSGDIRGMTPIKSAELGLSLSGSGHSKLQLDVDELLWKIVGSGSLSLEGTAANHLGEIAGSGDFNASKLKAKTVAIKISGSGKAEVNASDSLNVVVTGSGDVVYSGTAKLEEKIVGSGKVTKR